METFGSRQGRTTNNPIARTEDIERTESDSEILIYDKKAHHIHHLKSTVGAVWNLCNGERTTVQIADDLGVDVEKVTVSLELLNDAKLLAHPLTEATTNRRELAKRAGKIAIPAIISVSAPKAAAAASYADPGGSGCYNNSHCDSPFVCDYFPAMGDTAGNCVLP